MCPIVWTFIDADAVYQEDPEGFFWSLLCVSSPKAVNEWPSSAVGHKYLYLFHVPTLWICGHDFEQGGRKPFHPIDLSHIFFFLFIHLLILRTGSLLQSPLEPCSLI